MRVEQPILTGMEKVVLGEKYRPPQRSDLPEETKNIPTERIGPKLYKGMVVGYIGVDSRDSNNIHVSTEVQPAIIGKLYDQTDGWVLTGDQGTNFRSLSLQHVLPGFEDHIRKAVKVDHIKFLRDWPALTPEFAEKRIRRILRDSLWDRIVIFLRPAIR